MNLSARLYHMPTLGDRHQHEHHQLVVGVRGQAEFEIDGRGERVSPIRGCLAPADTTHYYQGQGHNDMVIIDLLPSEALHFGAQPQEKEVFNRLFDRADFFEVDSPLQHLLQFSALELDRFQQDPLIQRHISATILHSLHARIYGALPIKPPSERGIDLAAIDRYIADNLHRKISVQHLAALVHLSPSHFHALFKQQTGHSPHQYLLQIRLDTAATLLRESPLSLVEISHRTGFSSQSALSHALKKHRDITPSRLRRRL